MKSKAKYPKTYATIIRVITAKEFNRWTMPEGTLPIYVFQTDEGEIIEANYPELRGRIPRRVRVNSMLGQRVKLFKRDPQSKRWSYKYSGT